jgi:ABC-type Co2+ transport system, permease component
MHISEGFLSPQVLATGWTIAGIGVAVGLKKMNMDKIVPVAAMSSVFFLASLINVKVGPSSTHLSMIAPIGLILGWSSFPAVMIALILQAVLFQFGGLLVLGVNTVTIALPALIVYLLFVRTIREGGKTVSAAASFAAGFLAVVLCAVGVGCFLGFSDANFLGVIKIVFLTHLPLAVIEGVITLFLVAFLKRVAPDILMGVEKVGKVS